MKSPDIKEVQRRVANISVGASTLRNQGPGGLIENTRCFLAKLNLKELDGLTEEKFNGWLNENTMRLKKQFQEKFEIDNWGAARKALNIFLENAFYDRFLSSQYSLDKLEKFLELPLDSNTAGGLSKNCEEYLRKYGIQYDLPKWKTIKGLKREDSKRFQDCASKVAQKKDISRIYLDLKYWRAKEEVKPAA